MSDSTKFTFKDETDQEQAIDRKNLIADVPSTDGASSTIIYVQPDEKDDTTIPTVKVVKVRTEPATQRPQVASGRETHIVISTGSGTGKAQDFYNQGLKPVLEILFPASHDAFHIHTTESATSVLDLTNKLFLPKADSGTQLRIVILSGDGGIIDLVNGLLSKPASAQYAPPQVVLLPLGTANALYHSINAGRDNTWGLSSLAGDSISQPLPIFTATFSPGARLLVDEARKEEELSKDPETGAPILHGAVVASWGFHASLVADSDTAEYRKHGIERFKMAANDLLYPADGASPHHYKAKVSVLSGTTWTPLKEEEHMYVLASMVSNLEKPFTISPASKPLDGSLHLVRFGPTDGANAMRLMGLAYQGGKHVEDPDVLYQAIDGLRIEFEGREEDFKWRRICIDGKIVRLEKKGWVEIRKEERRVLDIAGR
ncbi:ATP-NAD kinase-like domain-containing protein [Lophiotrema nucula]|uniref:ATP-NAD kinase-like domain-containing protein n=1 Tax=Lophiotrema nucula TaxID=690887 RepID=A0A6A5YWZ3_9PLEO|nr:ATP-NAD kinase-like domain-containing protein [Lophiotrema nucula]